MLFALSHPLRIRILRRLLDAESCVTDFVDALDADQPKVSQHLRLLREAGLIRCRVEGRRRCYSLRRPDDLRRILRLAARLGNPAQQVTEAVSDPDCAERAPTG